MKLTQEERVLEALKMAQGNSNDGWVNGQHFLREMFLSQYHRAIWNLQNHKEKYQYVGEIRASDFTDEHSFKSYRLVGEPVQEALI